MQERKPTPRVGPRSFRRRQIDGWARAVLVGLLALAAPARATTISSSTTISTPITDNVLVNGAGTVVTIAPGGSVSGVLCASNSSTVNIAGGQVYFVDTFDSSTVNVSAGSMGGADMYGSSTLNFMAGSSGLGIFAYEHSTLNVSGGSLASVEGHDSAMVSITGGSFTYYIDALAGDTVTVTGCNLALSGDTLTGTLQDGTAIHVSTLTSTSGEGTGQIVLQHLPPQITCPPSVTVGNEPGLCGAHVSAAAIASTCGGVPAPVAGARSDGQPLAALYPIGTTTITWTATDAASSQAACTQMVTVHDTVPPVIRGAVVTPGQLWPPNHKLVPVTIDYTAGDTCGPVTSTLSVSNNETGAADAVVVDAHHVLLLADRDGNGSGRVYTITITCTDASGNQSTQPVTVTVPHNE